MIIEYKGSCIAYRKKEDMTNYTLEFTESFIPMIKELPEVKGEVRLIPGEIFLRDARNSKIDGGNTHVYGITVDNHMTNIGMDFHGVRTHNYCDDCYIVRFTERQFDRLCSRHRVVVYTRSIK